MRKFESGFSAGNLYLSVKQCNSKNQYMETLKFNTSIKASREKVWQVLWNDETYRKWTAVFGEGSHAESDWNEGSEILFLGAGGSDGMFSVIETKIPNEQMIFRHLGEIKNG